MLGSFVLVRGNRSGLRYGVLVSHNGATAVLRESRKPYSWSGGRLTAVDLAVVVGEMRLSRENEKLAMITDVISIDECTPEVEKFVREHPAEYES